MPLCLFLVAARNYFLLHRSVFWLWWEIVLGVTYLPTQELKKLNSEVRVGQNDFPSKFGKLEVVFFTKKQSLES